MTCRATHPKPCCSYQEHLRTFDCRARSRRSRRNGARICAGDRRRYGSCNRNTSVHASSSSARPCPSGGFWPAWISSLPAFRLDRLVILARVVLLWRRHDRCIDDLPAPGEIALVLQEPIKQIEQLFHRARLSQRLAIEPQSVGVGNRILQLQTKKAHEGEAITKLVFRLIIGEIVERLQHQRLEDHDFIPRLASGRILAFRFAPAKLAFISAVCSFGRKDSNGTIAAIAASGS